MARFPSGITPIPGLGVEDPRARAAQIALELDAHPIAASAPCMNPECGGPVDFLGAGPLPFYCSGTCRSRAATLRGLVQEQLEVIGQTLEQTKHLSGVPRDELRSRARMLRWWLVRLSLDPPMGRG